MGRHGGGDPRHAHYGRRVRRLLARALDDPQSTRSARGRRRANHPHAPDVDKTEYLLQAPGLDFLEAVLCPLTPSSRKLFLRSKPMSIGLGVTALVLIAVTRGRLGYRNYQQDDQYPATAPT